MSTTTKTRTTLPRHSAGWQALRIITDRAGKYNPAGPADWIRAKHRAITLEEGAQMIATRIRILRQVSNLHSRR